jgi:hypothetical protein
MNPALKHKLVLHAFAGLNAALFHRHSSHEIRQFGDEGRIAPAARWVALI